MKFTLELTDEELKTLKEHLKFRMQWIQAGMDEKEPLDFAIMKVVTAAEEAEMAHP